MREFEGTFASDPLTGLLSFTTEVAKLGDLPSESEIVRANGKLFTVDKVLPGPVEPGVKSISACFHVRREDSAPEDAEKHNKSLEVQFKTDFSTTIMCPGGGQYYVLPYARAKDLKPTDDIIINGNHREVFWCSRGIGPDGEPIMCVKVKGAYIDAPYDDKIEHFVFLVRDGEGRTYQVGDFGELADGVWTHVARRRRVGPYEDLPPDPPAENKPRRDWTPPMIQEDPEVPDEVREELETLAEVQQKNAEDAFDAKQHGVDSKAILEASKSYKAAVESSIETSSTGSVIRETDKVADGVKTAEQRLAEQAEPRR